MKAFRLLSSVLVLFTFGGGEVGWGASGPGGGVVELVGSAELSSTSTLEFRFARPMVAEDNLGPAADSPVVLQPPLPGSFVWLSTRSGVFLPEAPFTLGESWEVRLRPDLKDAAGASVTLPGQGPVVVVSTPSFGVTAYQTGVWEPDNVPATVEPRVAFNASVDLASVTGQAFFRSAEGDTIPAVVRFATGRDYFSLQPDQEAWDRSDESEASGGGHENDQEGAVASRELRNRLIFRPEQPLPPGAGWRFELGDKVRSLTGLVSTQAPLLMELGTVQPLQVRTLAAQNLVNSGPMVEVNFNLPLAPDITSETAGEFFQIKPSPSNLRWSLDWSGLTARGQFPVGKPHTLVIGEGVVGEDGRPFAGPREREFTVGPVNPRLYLPTITGQQLRYGRREFPVRWVNLEGVEFEVLRVAAKNLPAARKAMRDYQRSTWDASAPNEIYQPIPPGSIPGSLLKMPKLALPEAAPNRAVEGALPWDAILGDAAPGAVFLTAKGRPSSGMGGPSPAAQALIQLTDTGLFWKQDRTGLHVLTFSLQTGEPLPGVQVSLWDEEPLAKQRQATDANGQTFFELTETPFWLLAENGEDVEILPMGQAADILPVWSFQRPVEYGPWVAQETPVEGWRGVLFTDRPLYQAGETIQVRGFLRRIAGSALTLPGLTPVRLALFGPNGETVESTDLVASPEGDFTASIKAPLSPRGEYRLAFRPGLESFAWWLGAANTTFVVADYQPNAFEITVQFSPSTMGQNGNQAEVRAAYFFGGALGPSPVRWTLQSVPTDFNPPGFEQFRFLGFSDQGAAVRTNTGEAELPGGGRPLSLALPAGEAKAQPRQEVLTVEITDLNQQTVATRAERRVEASEFYLGLAPLGSGLFRAGQDVPIRVVAVNPKGDPVVRPVRYTATLIWRRPDVLRLQGAGQAVSFQTTTTEVPVGEVAGETLVPERRGEEWSVAEAPALALPVPRAGSYVLRLQAEDATGRSVMTEQFLYCSGEEETAWDYRNPFEIDLVPERATVAPGETARILVKNPLPGPALVFIERGQHILRAWPVNLEGNAPVIEIPIEEMDAPNIYVSLVILRGAAASARKFPMPEFRHGLASLRVENPGDLLDVQLQAVAEAYQPGETIQVSARVQDSGGRPVAGAGVTLWAVDDGILALTGYERPDPHGVFRAPLPLGVRTGISLTHLLPENPADLLFANKGYLIGGGGIDGAALSFREDFPGTIAWFPNLRTDASGEVKVDFPAPDALTRYRLVAVAHADATRFGTAESSVAIRKPVSLLSGVGTAAHTGDALTARAVVRNDSPESIEVRWELQLTGAQATGPANGTMALLPGQAGVLETPVVFDREGAARLAWTARATAEGGGAVFADALAVEVMVTSPMVTLRETLFPEIQSGDNDLLGGVNPQIAEGRGWVRVSVANSRLVGLGTSAEYLLTYPFGCAEQTASALVPWVTTALHPLFPEMAPRLSEAPEVVAVSCARLLDLRTARGGIGMWPGALDSSHFATAWTAVVWAQLTPAGFKPPAFPAELLEWLGQSLREEPRATDAAAWTERALILYALALHDQAAPAYVETLLEKAGLLTEDARALLALALVSQKGEEGVDERRRAAKGLLQSRGTTEAVFDPLAGPNRSLALRLLALVEVNPKSPEIAPAVAELLAGRRQGEWGNTQANAWALLALNRYREVGEMAPKQKTKTKTASQGKLIGPDREVALQLPPTTQPAAVSEEFAYSGSGADGTRQLLLQNPDGAEWFAETTFLITPPLGLQPAQNRGFGVERRYQKLAADGTLSPAEENQALRVGDRVLVTLILENAQPAAFVALRDPLPAVLEAINPDFRAEGQGILPAGFRPGTADFREILADEVRFFTDRLPPGRHVYQYLARVRQAGTVVAPGSKAEEMYRPERFGLGANQTLTAAALE